MPIGKPQIIVKGEDKTDSVRSWSQNGSKIDITYSNGKTYSYSESNVRFVRCALAEATALQRFEYLKRIADVVGLKNKQTGNTLASQYAKIDFVSEESMLAAFLNGKLNDSVAAPAEDAAVYPFGFNISQKQAVDNARSSKLSIIEGPPGTGKTQTILNIIANAVMRGESVAVVSSNNSATANVLDKLRKYELDFITAYLGNNDNKREFIDSQKPLPDLSAWKLSPERASDIRQQLQIRFIELRQMLEKKNELSLLKQELDAIEVEYAHFMQYYNESNAPATLPIKAELSADKLIELLLTIERYTGQGTKPGFILRLINRFRFGIANKSFYSLPADVIVSVLQKRFYAAKISELTATVSSYYAELERFDFNSRMKEYSELSAEAFRDKIAAKYGGGKRKTFELDDLRKNPEDFIAEYPVILSTAYSIRSSLSHKVMYDYVVVDEASQVDLATGALALSCAKKSVIVGDLKQLPNVVDADRAKETNAVFDEFNLSEVYRYANHSLLLAVTEMFRDSPRTLLREHYRCHPKIIGFCNRKFYNNELIILTEPKTAKQPLVVYRTAEGNHAREHVNQRQIDVIKQEVIPGQKLDVGRGSIGVVTPYRDQKNALQSAFAGTAVMADTVDKFQGRENDIIILSTVDDEVRKFADNANRLNVAVSRAIEQLIVVMSATGTERDTNIGDLVRYIEYENGEIIQSEIYSVFDYLYKQYREKRIALLKGRRRVSEYDSENLMFGLIRNVLEEERFSRFDVAAHVPLKMILRDPSKLDGQETRYAMNILTHVDFLIFDKLGKVPRLIIEVDGAGYHKAWTRQAERDTMKNAILKKYNLPYIRFKTNESNERERLAAALSGT